MMNTRFHVPIAFLFLSVTLCAHVQTAAPTRKTNPAQKPAFVCSNYSWTWYQNGLTTFTFSLKNQSGHDVKKVSFRVLFFDRQGNQIDFAESNTGPIPKGLAQRESVTLDIDTGMSTRKIRTGLINT